MVGVSQMCKEERNTLLQHLLKTRQKQLVNLFFGCEHRTKRGALSQKAGNKTPDCDLVKEFSTLAALCMELLLRSVKVQLNIWNKGKL